MTEDKKRRVKAPAFQCYADIFLADTAHLTNEEMGIYWRWILYAWVGIGDCKQGELPNDDEILRRLVNIGRKKMSKISRRVKALFKVRYGKMMAHKRLLQEREKQVKRSLDAQKAAEKKWEEYKRTQCDRNATALPKDMRTLCTPSPTPIPSPTTEDLESKERGSKPVPQEPPPSSPPQGGVIKDLENAFEEKAQAQPPPVNGTAHELLTRLALRVLTGKPSAIRSDVPKWCAQIKPSRLEQLLMDQKGGLHYYDFYRMYIAPSKDEIEQAQWDQAKQRRRERRTK